jgi:hypothetical protein
VTDVERRKRGLARLAELGDEPGGEEFLARMGDLGGSSISSSATSMPGLPWTRASASSSSWPS